MEKLPVDAFFSALMVDACSIVHLVCLLYENTPDSITTRQLY